jgi:hypothetical protein
MNFQWILDRLREPSSYAGIAAFVGGAFGFHVSADFTAQVAAAGVAVAGLVAFVLKDKAKA